MARQQVVFSAFLSVLVGAAAARAATRTPSPAARQTAPAIRCEFLGAKALRDGSDALSLRQTLREPETQRVLAKAAEKLAAAIAAQCGKAGDPNAVAAVQDVLGRLARQGFRLEAQFPRQSPRLAAAEWRLELALPENFLPDAMEQWRELARALGGAPREVQEEGLSFELAVLGGGWETAALASKGRFVAAVRPPNASGALRLASLLKTRLPSPKRGKAAWLRLQIDSPCWEALSAALRGLGLPDADIRIYGKGKNLRTEALLRFDSPRPLELVPWKVPTNLIREPLISFWALRGAGNLLRGCPLIRELGLDSAPNRIFGWSVAKLPFFTYWAFELPDPTNALRRMAPRLTPALRKRFAGLEKSKAVYLPQQNRLVVTNVFFLVPFATPAPSPCQDLAVAGLTLPLWKEGDPPPPELLAQLQNDKNLIYYHWELTSQQAPHWWNTYFMYSMLAGYAPYPKNGAMVWLSRSNILNRLGNTVTRVVRQAPDTWKLERSSALGFTGLELLQICRWLDGERFPAWAPPRRLTSTAQRKKPARANRAERPTKSILRVRPSKAKRPPLQHK